MIKINNQHTGERILILQDGTFDSNEYTAATLILHIDVNGFIGILKNRYSDTLKNQSVLKQIVINCIIANIKFNVNVKKSILRARFQRI